MVSYYNNSKKNLIVMSMLYLIMIFAVFSDILRFENSSLTFFRISIPLCVLVLAMYPTILKKFVVCFAGLTILTIIQYFLFYKVIRPGLPFDFSIFMKFYMLYFCAFMIFFLIKIIKNLDDRIYEKSFAEFLIVLGIALFIIAVIDHFDGSFFGGLQADNQNNYGCYIAALIPFLLLKLKEKFSGWLTLVLVGAVVLLYINDSKAALFGVIIEMIIFFCINKEAVTRKKMFQYRYLIIIISAMAIVGIIIINPRINGYSMRDTILHPVVRILTNNPYPDYGSSIAYRTNTTLYVILMILKTGFLGVGMGNTGVLLKHDFPNINPEYEMAMKSPFLSLHNAWLETALDIGIVSIIIYIIILKNIVKMYFTKRKLTQIEQLRVMFVIGFPIWIISASGIYTQYYLFAIMAYLLFADKNKKIFYGKNTE